MANVGHRSHVSGSGSRADVSTPISGRLLVPCGWTDKQPSGCPALSRLVWKCTHKFASLGWASEADQGCLRTAIPPRVGVGEMKGR